VVSRGERPDLAGADALRSEIAPTLLIVGGADYGVIELNQQAEALLNCERKLTLISGTTHLFDEPGSRYSKQLAVQQNGLCSIYSAIRIC
jgi:hypothetical protein